MSHIVEITDPTEISSYRLVWNWLLGDTPHASFFHTSEWLEAYLAHFGDRHQLRILVVYGSNGPIGIVPLCIRRERFGVGRLRVLTYPMNGWGGFCGPIGPNPSATLLVAMRYLKQRSRDWDLLDLRSADNQHRLGARTERAMRAAGFGVRKNVWRETPIVAFDGTWESYTASRDSKWTRVCHRFEKRLAEQGKIEFVRYRPRGEAQGQGEPRWELYESCQQLATNNPTGATPFQPDGCAFLRDCHGAAAKKGMLDVNLLYVNGIPVSFAYNYHCRGNVIGVQMGPERQRTYRGADFILASRMIRDSFQRDDRRYEFGPGSPSFPDRFCNSVEASYSYSHLPISGLRPQVFRLTQWTTAPLRAAGIGPSRPRPRETA